MNHNPEWSLVAVTRESLADTDSKHIILLRVKQFLYQSNHGVHDEKRTLKHIKSLRYFILLGVLNKGILNGRHALSFLEGSIKLISLRFSSSRVLHFLYKKALHILTTHRTIDVTNIEKYKLLKHFVTKVHLGILTTLTNINVLDIGRCLLFLYLRS